MERSTSEDDLGVVPRSTPEQQGVADSEFIELEDAPADKARNILKGNEEFRVAPLTPSWAEALNQADEGSRKILLPYTIFY